jgi:hypothetical protein
MVESYWPDVTREAVAAAIDRGLAIEDAMLREGRPVRHLRTTLIPAEEALFSFFEADSVEDVAEFNRRADFPFDRVIEAVSIEPEKMP